MNTINEHLGLIDEIDFKLHSFNSENDKTIKYNLNYINEDEHCAIELSIFSELSEKKQINYLDKIIYNVSKSDIVFDIYTIENEKIYVIYLLPLNNIRNNKIKRLKNKLELVHQ